MSHVHLLADAQAQLVGRSEAARLAGVCEQTILNLARRGVLSVAVVGHRRLYDRAQVLAVAARRKAGPTTTQAE